MLEIADGKLRAMTTPSKEPKRTKVNLARGTGCGGHITLTLAAKAGPRGIPNCVFGASLRAKTAGGAA